jgi:hypothetical protein
MTAGDYVILSLIGVMTICAVGYVIAAVRAIRDIGRAIDTNWEDDA